MSRNTGPDSRSFSETGPSTDIEAGIRAIADNLGEGLAVIQDSCIVFMNDMLSEVTGISRRELEFRNLNEILTDEFEHRQYLEVRNRREKGESIDYPRELQFKTANDRIIEMRNRSSVIQWSGRPATVHFLEDITRTKEIERLLTQQTGINAIITDTVSRILASPMSLDETVGTVMDSAMDLTGSRSGTLVIEDENGEQVFIRRCESSCSHCILPELMRTIMDDGDRLARSRPGRLEGSFYLNGGMEKTAEAAGCPAWNGLHNLLRVPVGGTGRLSGQIILAGSASPFGPWDLDAMEKVAEVLNLALVRHRAVEDLRLAKETAEREADSRSQFLANVTHEVRSPLNGVLMMASLLQDSGLDADQEELLGVVMFSARTIDRLIRDLTDINQIRAGKFRVYNAEFDLGELCRHILEIQKPEALRKGLLLDYSVDTGVSLCYGDRERIGQIIANLVTNAVRYTNTGGVRLEAGTDGTDLFLAVSDTGPGIPQEKQQDVFDMFRQLEGADRGEHSEGSGIGLAVVKRLVDAMNGRIELESHPGRGSVFTVFLPVLSPSESTVVENASAETSVASAIPRVLVAEDEGGNRLYLRTMLEQNGCSVDEAFDGNEAVSLAAANDYDLILMDINMPRMDGLEASSRIRETGSTVPIVAVTSHVFAEDRFHILQAGLDDIVRKPISEQELGECLNRYIRD